MKRMALYNPYMDTLGGGEEHILIILQVLLEHGYHLDIFWDDDLTNAIKMRFNLNLVENRLTWRENIFNNRHNLISKLKITSRYDKFFYVPDGSYFISLARQNYIFAMVPKRSLYPHQLADRLKTFNFKYIANSQFTQRFLNSWGFPAQVIYPHIEVPSSTNFIKKPIILNVGRFFKHLHAKRQDVAIATFLDLHKYRPDLELHLVGACRPQDEPYLQELKQQANHHKNIYFHINVPRDRLLQLYNQAQYYWHFAGYGLDDQRDPELVEHLGIAPLEAMAHGCATFCYKAGGPTEIIRHGQTGFLFEDKIKLQELMLKTSSRQISVITAQAQKYITENFSRVAFTKRVKEVLL